jgi:delta1-piperideine-2-carboxylate reductase
MTMRLSFDDLSQLLRRVFQSHGASAEVAKILSENCAACERDGEYSHGLFRIPGYLSSLDCGWVDGAAEPLVEQVGASFLRVDAANGFAQPALAAALGKAMDIAAVNGVAVVAIRDSHHFSALSQDIEPIAEAGLVALTMVTGQACVAAPGGRRPVYGTNPIAFATPVAGGSPLVFDFATSAMANGNVRLAARAGDPVPAGTGIDADGRLTGSPRAILEGGALLPFGGHKGAALSLMVEVLASAVTGGLFSSEVDLSRHPGAETPRTGQLAILINPSIGRTQDFASRIASLIATVRASGDVRLPSDRRYKHRAQSMADGILLEDDSFAELNGFIGDVPPRAARRPDDPA